MRPLVNKITPAQGFAGLLHSGLLILLPLILLALRQYGSQFVALSLALIILSKWRMFAVRPRFWATLIRANAIDIIIGVSVVVFLQHSAELWLQLIWTLLYAAWLLKLKPASGPIAIAAQAAAGQLAGLVALFSAFPDASAFWLVLGSAIICYVAARHFFDGFDEPYSRMLAYLWGYFGAGLVWALSHWLIFYGGIAQPVLLLSTTGYGLAALYYFDHHGKLSLALKRQFVFIMLAIVVVIITFSDWGDKVV